MVWYGMVWYGKCVHLKVKLVEINNKLVNVRAYNLGEVGKQGKEAAPSIHIQCIKCILYIYKMPSTFILHITYV